MYVSKRSPFHGSDSQDHGRLFVGNTSRLSRVKKCTHVSTHADTCALTSESQHSSRRCRFQTGQTPEKPARVFGLLGPCLETLLTPWSVFRNSNDGNVQTLFLWEPGTCGHDRSTRSSWSRFPHDELNTGLNSQVRHRTVVAKRAPEQTAAVGGHTSRRQRVAQTATKDVIDRPRGLPQKSSTSRARGALARQESRGHPPRP